MFSARKNKTIKPYGDISGDGAVQVSFTLPQEASPWLSEAAKAYAQQMGLERLTSVHMEAIDAHNTFFVIYGHSNLEIDGNKIKVNEAAFELWDRETLIKRVQEKLRRQLIVVGATTGTDAHTVGLDAIMSVKGYRGDHGLESYSCFQAHNLRAQVDLPELMNRLIQLKADVVLLSQVVSQRDQHLEQLKEFVKLAKSTPNLAKPLVKICGGPRITHEEAIKIGFEAGFGSGTSPHEVANYIVQEYLRQAK